jgi:hypothetical protein
MSEGGGRSVLQVVLGAAYGLATLPLSVLLAVAGVFAITPTQCPEEGASYLCTSGPGVLATVAAIGLLLLAFVGFGIAAPFGRSAASAWRRVGLSVLCGAAALGVQAFAATSWTT